MLNSIFAKLILATASNPSNTGVQGQGGLGQLFGSPWVMLSMIFAIFYFLVIKPQQKKQKEHQGMLDSIRRGDKIVTTGGIHGAITGIDKDIITLEVAEKVRIKVSRNAVVGVTEEKKKK